MTAANDPTPRPKAPSVRVTIEVSFALDRTQAAGAGPFDSQTLAQTLLDQVRDELVEHFNQGAVSAAQIRITERKRGQR